MTYLIGATILTGKYKGEEVLIPNIPIIIPSDMPFNFKRIQCPIRLAFDMTINKSQGQSLEVCGLNLEYPCFWLCQLDGRRSLVGKPSSLYVTAPEGTTKYVLYQRALE